MHYLNMEEACDYFPARQVNILELRLLSLRNKREEKNKQEWRAARFESELEGVKQMRREEEDATTDGRTVQVVNMLGIWSQLFKKTYF